MHPDQAPSAQPSNPPRSIHRVALLINPVSGRGRGRSAGQIAAARLRESGLDVHELEGTDYAEASHRAHTAVREHDALIVCGGDGMVSLGAQAVAGTGVPLGIIPAGTGNDVARYLGLDRKDPARAADRIIARHTRTMDLARSGDRRFVTVLAAGFDAVVNERANQMTWPTGQMRYNLATLLELPRFSPLTYILDLDGVVRRVDAMLVAVGNGPSFGGGLRITEGAVIDDGWLDVVIVKAMSKLRLVRLYPQLFTGGHTSAPEYEHHRVRSVTVSAPGIVAYADGERFGALPLTVSCEPGAMEVFA